MSLEDDVSEKVREFLRETETVSRNEDVHSWVSDNFNGHDVDKGSSEYWRLANEGKESYGCWPDCDDVESAVDQLVDDAVRSRIASAILSVIQDYDLDDFEELTTTDPRDEHGDPVRTDDDDEDVDIWRVDGEYVGWKHIDISEHDIELWGRVEVDVDDNLEKMEEACDPPPVISSPPVIESFAGSSEVGESQASRFAKRWARK